MRTFWAVALLAGCGCLQAGAQSKVELPDLPAPAGKEPSMPALPPPTSTYDPVPENQPAALPQPPPPQMTEEQLKKLKQDENWLVEAMQQKQAEEEALRQKRLSEQAAKKDLPENKEPTVKPGDLSAFKPVLADNSLASLNPKSGDAIKNKNQNPFSLDAAPSLSNPVNNANVGAVKPILGPKPNPQVTGNLNSGLGVTPLPQTGIKKISSNPNFVPDGYQDSWATQQNNPYPMMVPPKPKPLPPPTNVAPRPTFRDLANTIPDPASVR